MKNGTYDCAIHFSALGVGLRIPICYETPEIGIKTEPQIAISTFKSYLVQHTIPHCTFWTFKSYLFFL
jgi:hypothetical protein